MLRDLGGLVYEIHRTGGADMTSPRAGRRRQGRADPPGRRGVRRARDGARRPARRDRRLPARHRRHVRRVRRALSASDARFCAHCGQSTTEPPVTEAEAGRADPPVDPRGTLNLFAPLEAERPAPPRSRGGRVPAERRPWRAGDAEEPAAVEEPAAAPAEDTPAAEEPTQAAEPAGRATTPASTAPPPSTLQPGDPLASGSAREHRPRARSAPQQPVVVEEAPGQRHCPRCGAAMTDEQEWCLRCGAAVGTRIATAPGWRVPLDRHRPARRRSPPIAIAIAIIQLADDTDEVPATVVADRRRPRRSRRRRPRPRRRSRPTRPRRPRRRPRPSATPTPDDHAGPEQLRRVAEWPAGENGWTVVLASESSEDAARDSAEDFAAEGIPEVGILNSDDFSSLKAGFWVVFAGQYDTQAEAHGGARRDRRARRLHPPHRRRLAS